MLMNNPGDNLPDYDVVIAGGGLVGGSLAVALAGSDLRVALIEAVPHDSDAHPGFDDRSIALSHGSCNILRQLGLWSAMRDDAFPITRIHVSEQRRFGSAVIDAAEQGISELGHVIKGWQLGRALWQRLEELSAAESLLDVYCPARVTTTEPCGDADSCREITVVAAAGEQRLRTRLLVVADGARSALRDALGVTATEDDYRQVAVVASVQVDRRHAANTAYERFTPDGPLAMLPGADGRYTVVLARAADAVAAVNKLGDGDFLQLVQSSLGFRLGRLRKPGKRVAYPLSLVQTATLTTERAVMIGNAAHGLHPVAGQGFNLGLRDAASLAELLTSGRRESGKDFDCGAPDVLQAYAAWRHDDQRKVVAFTDGLIRLFGRRGRLLSHGRGLGLAMFDVFPAGKRLLARQTMGLAGRMTRLGRGLDL